MPTKLSAVLITRNEERNLEDCLRALAFADEIIIVDSGSTDATPQIAARFSARFFTRPFDHFAAQKNDAISRASGDWVLSIDADERISPELAEEIKRVLQNPGAEGYWIRRENFFFGSRMRHGVHRDDYQLRLFRRGKGSYQGNVHERIVLEGTSLKLAAPMEHHSTQNLEDYFRRLTLYTDLEAEKIFSQGIRPNAVHIVLRPVAEFIYFYFLRLGFLDGITGLQYQVLSSFYTSVKYMKALELYRKAPKPLREKIAV